ncbi:MAG: ABC transporter ATP-binding protein, partial [Spirochaetales bacterium]|nr:ABC transporter ATP-binding protein [Spirochaetales bacterium]
VSALDVSIQAQVLNLLLDLHDKYKFTYIFIAHDLAVVEFISTRILVMYLGKIVETADKKELVKNHLHPYTKALFDAFPATDPKGRDDRDPVLMGDVPSPINPPTGCYFHPRCPRAMDKCKMEYPPLKEVSPGHKVACWLYEKVDDL